MQMLLSADLYRLRKSKLFWIINTGIFLFGALVYYLAGVNLRKFGRDWITMQNNMNFFIPAIYLGAVLAVFHAIFIGIDYADGTLRNKICVGHGRTQIYLSNFITALTAGLCFFTSHILAAAVVGLPCVGAEVFCRAE